MQKFVEIVLFQSAQTSKEHLCTPALSTSDALMCSWSSWYLMSSVDDKGESGVTAGKVIECAITVCLRFC